MSLKKIVLCSLISLSFSNLLGCMKDNPTDNMNSTVSETNIPTTNSSDENKDVTYETNATATNSYNENKDTTDDKKNISSDSFVEKDYTISTENLEKLKAILGELYFLNEDRYEKSSEKDGIPIDDSSKEFFFRMLFGEHYGFMNDLFESYREGATLCLQTSQVNSAIQLIIGTSLSDEYDTIFKIPLGNRGCDQPFTTISNIKQTSQNTVKITGFIGVANENENDFFTKENFIALGTIANDTRFGGITITSFSYDSQNKFNSQFIFFDSDSRYLTDDEVKNLSLEELAYARNEIYARYGYIFKENKFKNYFKGKSWYHPNSSFIPNDENLNKYEIANRDLILKYENLK